MQKHYETVTDERGNALLGYRVRVKGAAGSEVAIFSDNGGTRFRDAAGNIINEATTNELGRYEFYWEAAEGQTREVLSPSGELKDALTDFFQYPIFTGGAALIGLSTGGTVEDAFTYIVPNGTDTAAVQAAIDLCNLSAVGSPKWVYLDPRKTYDFSSGPLRFGTATANSNMMGFNGNMARIVGIPDGQPCFDLVGVRNRNFQVQNVFLNDPTGAAGAGECMFALARPKLASGAVSSGNVWFSGCVIFGQFTAGVIRNVQSESCKFDKSNKFWNFHGMGVCIAATRHDYFKDTAWIEYDGKAGAAFTAGEIITGTAGAVGTILHTPIAWTGTEGGFLLWVTAGTFTDNMALTGSGGGTALANGLPHVNGSVSDNPALTLGVEEGSTAARMSIHCSVNAAKTVGGLGRAGLPPIFISDYTDVTIDDADINANTTALAYVHVQQDMTKNAARGQPPVGFQFTNSYNHSDHAYDLTIGDPNVAAAVGAECENWTIGPQKNAGSPTAMIARVKYIGRAGYPMRAVKIESDHDVDLRGVTLKYNNFINLVDPNYSGLKLDQICSAKVQAFTDIRSRILLTMSNNANNVSIDLVDLGQTEAPPRDSVRTIASGAITVNRRTFRIETEGAAATDDLDAINLPTGVQAAGLMFTFGVTNAARVVTVKAGARILTPADIVLNTLAKSVTVIGESGSGTSAIFRVMCINA